MSGPEVIPLVDAFADEQLTGEWLALVRETGGSFFVTPCWTRAWWEWAGSPPGRLATWRTDDGCLEAAAALVTMKERLHPRFPLSVRVLTNLGTGPASADHCGWVASRQRLGDVWSWVRNQGRRTSLLLRSLDPDTAHGAPPDAIEIARSRCPRLSIGDDAERVGSKSFRKKIRQYGRRLDREGATIRWIPPGELQEYLVDELYALHEDRHSLKDEESALRVSQRRLHKRLVQLSESCCGPAAVLAEADGRTVGLLYGFLFERTFAYYQSGWDPDWARLSLGTVLTASAIEHAIAEGATVFDFLRGPEEYKYRFGAEDRVDTTLLLPRGIGGLLLRMKYRVRDRVRNRDDG